MKTFKEYCEALNENIDVAKTANDLMGHWASAPPMMQKSMKQQVVGGLESLIQGQDYEGIAHMYPVWSKEQLQQLLDMIQ
jgi:hypothetical protein